VRERRSTRNSIRRMAVALLGVPGPLSMERRRRLTVCSNGCTTKPPCNKTPSTKLNFGWNSTVLGVTLVSIFLSMHKQKYIINGHFVHHKQSGNEI